MTSTVFDQRPNVTVGGGAVTIWSNGATVLDQLGVDMDGAGQLLSSRAGHDIHRSSAGHDGPRRDGEPVGRAHSDGSTTNPAGTAAERLSDRSRPVQLPRGRRGQHTRWRAGRLRRRQLGARRPADRRGRPALGGATRSSARSRAKPTGWCSWQGLVTVPEIAEPRVATMMIGEHGNLGLWPAGGTDLQWWFDLPWSPDFVRPQRPIELIRSHFTGWSDTVDQVLATLTDDGSCPVAVPAFPASDSATPAQAR